MPEPEEKKPLTGTVTIERKLNDNNYGHGQAFLSISNITKDTTLEEIEEELDAQDIAFKAIKKRVLARVQELIK